MESFVKISVDLYKETIKTTEIRTITSQTTRAKLYTKLKEILEDNIWDEVIINIEYIKQITDVLTRSQGKSIIKKER